MIGTYDGEKLVGEQKRIRGEFEEAFGDGLIGKGFKRDNEPPAFVLYQG